jgi:uncharacterized protein YjcR
LPLEERRNMNNKNDYKMTKYEAEQRESKLLQEINDLEKQIESSTELVKHLYMALEIVREIKERKQT